MKRRRNANGTPPRMLVALLAQWMAEGKYSQFIQAFAPRIQAGLVKGIGVPLHRRYSLETEFCYLSCSDAEHQAKNY